MISSTDCRYKGRQERQLRDIPITVRLNGPVTISRGYVRFGQSPRPNWPAVGEKRCRGDIGILWRVGNNEYRGGRFDHLRETQALKGLENIYGGIVGAQPEHGQTVYFYLINDEQTERSNIVACKDKWE